METRSKRRKAVAVVEAAPPVAVKESKEDEEEVILFIHDTATALQWWMAPVDQVPDCIRNAKDHQVTSDVLQAFQQTQWLGGGASTYRTTNTGFFSSCHMYHTKTVVRQVIHLRYPLNLWEVPSS